MLVISILPTILMHVLIVNLLTMTRILVPLMMCSTNHVLDLMSSWRQ